MKKMMMLAAMAMLAVTAQAISFDWDNATTVGGGYINSTTNTKWEHLITPSDYSASDGSFGVRVTYAGTAASTGNYAWTTMLCLGIADDHWYQLKLTDNDKTRWLTNSEDGESGANDNTAGAISYGETVNHTYSFLYDATAKTMEIAITENGTTTSLKTLTDVTIDGTQQVSLWAGSNNKSLATIFNGTATYTVQVIPEPTALALLALGVAGVALKRKMK